MKIIKMKIIGGQYNGRVFSFEENSFADGDIINIGDESFLVRSRNDKFLHLMEGDNTPSLYETQ